jgi:hypothetical protein
VLKRVLIGVRSSCYIRSITAVVFIVTYANYCLGGHNKTRRVSVVNECHHYQAVRGLLRQREMRVEPNTEAESRSKYFKDFSHFLLQ